MTKLIAIVLLAGTAVMTGFAGHATGAGVLWFTSGMCVMLALAIWVEER